eukprot:511156-Pelagomonas_calceolata.AAC.1
MHTNSKAIHGQTVEDSVNEHFLIFLMSHIQAQYPKGHLHSAVSPLLASSCAAASIIAYELLTDWHTALCSPEPCCRLPRSPLRCPAPPPKKGSI